MIKNWLERHVDPVSRMLHYFGIPLTILAIPALVIAVRTGEQRWYVAALVLLVGGYCLQFIGHAIEGNDAGEVILVKKLLGKPYRAVAEKKGNHELHE